MKKIYSLLLLCLFTVLQASIKPVTGFIENKGQIHDQYFKPNTEVRYLLSIPGMNIQLKQNSFSYDTYTVEQKSTEATHEIAFTKLKHPKIENTYYFHRVDVEFIGANTEPEIVAENPSEAYYNYYTTGTFEQGATNVRSYEKVTYKNIYPNIDLEFIAKEGKLKYNFIVHNGGNMNVIKWKYHGANTTEIKNNNISIAVKQGEFNEAIPESYLRSNSKKGKQIKIDFIKDANSIYSFNCKQNLIPRINQDLIIDPNPIVLWSTYFGGTNDDYFYDACKNGYNGIYLTGYTQSSNNIATTGAFQSVFAGGTDDALIVKFNSTGSRIWSTYYGGTGWDDGYSIKIDLYNSLFIAGATSSTNSIATSLSYQPVYGGGTYDNYLLKLDTNGNRIFATYFGGAKEDSWGHCSVDSIGNVFLTGATSSTNAIASVGAHQVNYGGGASDAFITKFSNSGNLIWSTYYGGSLDDLAWACCCDKKGNIYFTGETNSFNGISTPGTLQSGFGGSVNSDAFIAKLNQNGVRKWATYYGGCGEDRGMNLTFDDNSLFVCGDTYSNDSIASVGSFQTLYGGNEDAFIGRFDTSGVRLWGTYYGGTGFDYFLSLTTDNNNIYLGGTTASYTGVATPGAYQTSYSGGPYGDILLIKMNKSGILQWGTYYGDFLWETAQSVIIDNNSDIYIAGCTVSTVNIATSGSYQSNCGGAADGYLAKLRQNSVTEIQTLDLKDKNLLIYPNPNSGSFTIQTKEDVVLEIVNELGQVVRNIKLDASNIHQTNITGLADGVYCLKDKLSGTIIKNKIVVVR